MRKVSIFAAAAGLISSFPGVAQVAAAPDSPPVTGAAKAPSQIQSLFDAGSAAMRDGNWQQSLETYKQLESMLLAKTPNSKSLAIVRLRIGQSLYALGRHAEAEPLIQSALAALPANNSSFDADRYVSFSALGAIRARNFDYADALRQHRSALAIAVGPVEKLNSYDRLVQLGIFVDPDAVLVDIDAAQALIAQHPEANKEWTAKFRYLRGRTLMNMGRLPEARAELDRAIKELGGLTSLKINLLDTAARSDAAIAALLANDRPTAQRYLAYAGASDQAQEGFRIGRSMDVPQCGGKNGPKPEDVAVVELNILPNGAVGNAYPIYYSGVRSAAVEFAKAVSQWSWTPEELERVPIFYRALARIELRCTNAFNRPSVLDQLGGAARDWLSTIGATDFQFPGDSDATRLVANRTEIVRQESRSGRDSKDLIYPYAYLALNSVALPDERKSAAQRAYELAVLHGAPARARAYMGLLSWFPLEGSSNGKIDSPFQKAIQSALSDPAFTRDAVAVAALRLSAFDALNIKARGVAGAALIRPVADDPSLPEVDPFKVGARTRLANLLYNQGQVDEARQQLSQSGLSEQQCALVDAKPALKSGRLSAADYPNGAYTYGFGGWATVEFDIGADGRTVNQRPIVAWPPFVLGEAIADGVKRFKYEQSYRPGGSLGCSSMRYSQVFKFILP
jgi:tetratricopeptide (TPR) repeat protein